LRRLSQDTQKAHCPVFASPQKSFTTPLPKSHHQSKVITLSVRSRALKASWSGIARDDGPLNNADAAKEREELNKKYCGCVFHFVFALALS
jgi:5-methylcytosine-specific restriction endonuclease McrA